jgi:PAS domain S-box-containing protein
METSDLRAELKELALQNSELRATQRALEASRRSYLDLFDFAPIAYFTLSRSGYVQEANRAAAALLDRPLDELLDRPFPVVVHLEHIGTFFRHLERCWHSGERTVTELTLETISGRRRVVQMESAPLGLSGGRPAAIRTTMSDITECKDAEHSLRQAAAVEHALRDRLQLLTDASLTISDQIPANNLEGVLRVIVEQVRAMVGAEAAAIGVHALGAGFEPFVAVGLDRASVERLRAGDEVDGLLSVGVQWRGAEAGRLFVATRRGAGELSAEDLRTLEALMSRVGPAVEIARLREQEARERGRLELLADASAITARTLDFDAVLAAIARLALPRLGDSCVVYVQENGKLRQAAVAHVDPTLEPLLRRAHAALMALPGVALAQRAFESGQVTLALDIDLRALEGRASDSLMADLRQLTPCSIIALPLTANGHSLGVAALAWCSPEHRYDDNDVVLLRALFERAGLALENARLYRDLSKALQAREDMLAVVAHDLRNPLSSIKINADLLLRKLGDAPERAHAARQEQAARNMLRLVDDLLDAAALDAGAVTLELDRHSAGCLIEQATAQLAAAADKRKVRVEPIGDLEAEVRCDAQRMVQVLSNLLGNAIKFSPENGVVHVTARRAGPRLEISVCDDGPGIPEDLRENLFRRYWKGQKLGTGLGLYIAKRIVDAHGGRLEVASAPGRGATFTVVL